MAKVVGILSGKGGTGKTLVASVIARRLHKAGKKTGIIDADIDSPNMDLFFNFDSEIRITPDKRIVPAEVDGIQIFSMGLLVKNRPVSMEGSEYAEILRDVVEQGEWKCEYLVVDMPASSSDEFKWLISAFDSYLGSIVVTQPAHKADAEKVIELHQNNDVPILGLIENMSYFKAGKGRYEIFGKSTVAQLGKKYGVDVLGKIPLTMDVRTALNEGREVTLESRAIDQGVEKILAATPKKISIFRAIREGAMDKIEENLLKLLANTVLVANKDIDIGELQRRHGFKGGRNIQLVITDDKWTVLVDEYMRIQDGKIISIKKEPKVIHSRIFLKAKALPHAMKGKKKLSSGREVKYDLLDAFLQGDARVYGRGDSIRAISFCRDVFGEVMEHGGSNILPLIEKVIG